MDSTENNSFGYMPGGLPEDFVKRRFVPFLKNFYKHRYEPPADSIQVNFDNVSASGLVADIVMSFRKSDDSPFVCACEATSREKAGEVKFTLNLVYFIWDAVAFGAFFSAIVYAFFYETQIPWLLDLHATGNLGLIIGSFTIGFFGWYFTMQRWRKYRYIFAIEQFKRYEADEQWVALADDVFPAPSDPYLIELKNQCVYNGFGLALVPEEGDVRVLNAPSRLGSFGEDRRMVQWLTRSQWYQTMTAMTNTSNLRPPDMVQTYWNKTKHWAQYLVIEPFKKYVWSILSKPFGQTTSVFNRFMSGQTVQKWVFVLCTLAIVPMCLDVLTRKEEDIADLEKLQNWHGGANPEDQPGYVLDGPPIPFDGKPKGVPKQYPISKNAPDEDIQTIDLSGSDDEEEEYAGKPADTPRKTASKPKAAATQTISDPCGSLGGKNGWVVQDNVFGKQDYAAARASALKASGVTAQSTPRSCFEGGGSGFIVWLGRVQSSEPAAKKAAADLENTLLEKGLLKGKLLVRKI
ncbi:MAG TPA: hypothetical protein PK228_12760 [Saprospiraceae bacterium]|nr:hypothetical protein [Saprospiraceae bacterium]